MYRQHLLAQDVRMRCHDKDTQPDAVAVGVAANERWRSPIDNPVGGQKQLYRSARSCECVMGDESHENCAFHTTEMTTYLTTSCQPESQHNFNTTPRNVNYVRPHLFNVDAVRGIFFFFRHTAGK
jgi:hypothetical protein